MPLVSRLQSNIPVVHQFLERLRKEKPSVYNQIVLGEDTLTTFRRVASIVGYTETISEDRVIVDVLNAMWPFIIAYEG